VQGMQVLNFDTRLRLRCGVVSNNLVFSETSVDLHSRLHRLHVHYVHYTFSGTFFPLALAIFYSAVIKSLCKNSVLKKK
jgi:hypothetical protein